MGYREWFERHGAKHRAIVDRLSHLSDAELIAYFRYDNMALHEPDSLYAKGTKCHEMEDLNCYLCACPHFRFDDAGLGMEAEGVRKSLCAINARDARSLAHDGVIHCDCSACLLPHRESFIANVFDRNWFAIMERVASSYPPSDKDQ